MAESNSEMPTHIEMEAMLKLPAELQMVPPIPPNLMPCWFICTFSSGRISL